MKTSGRLAYVGSNFAPADMGNERRMHPVTFGQILLTNAVVGPDVRNVFVGKFCLGQSHFSGLPPFGDHIR